jgi:hypothetical protein
MTPAPRMLALPARVFPPLFVPTAAVLSVVNRAALEEWGWRPLDHSGVPWPSSLALLPGGRLQALSFAGSGASLISLAVALPRGARSRSLAACGAGLMAAALPLDPPDGDASELASWIRSWPAAVHAGGFVVAGAAGILAVGASRQRADVALAGLLAGAAAAGRTPGWYAFVSGFFAWVTVLARRAARGADAPLPGAIRQETRRVPVSPVRPSTSR